MTFDEIRKETWEQRREIAIRTQGQRDGTRIYLGEAEYEAIFQHRDCYVYLTPSNVPNGRDTFMGLEVYIVLDDKSHIKVV